MFHRRQHHSATNRPVGNRRRWRPQLTALEVRTLLSNFTVTNTADNGNGSLAMESASRPRTPPTTPSRSTRPSLTTRRRSPSTPGRSTCTKATGTLTIQGPGANLLSVSGNNASGVFTLLGGSAYLSGLTVTGGRAVYGAGLYNVGGTVTLSDCTVSGNSASNDGGGILNVDGTATLTNCTVSDDSASTYGGGLFMVRGTTTLTNCTVSGNSTTRRWPDQFLRYGHADQLHGQRQLRQRGCGLNNSRGTATLTNCTVSGNSADEAGGGLYNGRHSPADRLHRQRQLRRLRRRRRGQL